MQYDVSLQTIAWINELKNNGQLEINPEFQRRAVWLEKERSQLLASIILELPFPEVYYQIETDSDSGKQKYIVVDGQQRTTSILKFIDNEFPLPNVSPLDSKYFKDLDKDEKERFWNYKVVVRFLKRTNNAEIRDIFQRLNTNNVKLTDQELRNAKYEGAYKALCERLADSPFFQNISLFTAREVRRMSDIEYVSELVLQQIYGVTNKKDLLESAYAKFNEELPNEAGIEEEFDTIINLIRTLISPENLMFVKTKTNFYSLFGAVLEYYRKTKNAAFSDLQLTKSNITSLFARVRDEGETSEDQMIIDYSEAYNRAASDKARRVNRQKIIENLLV